MRGESLSCGPTGSANIPIYTSILHVDKQKSSVDYETKNKILFWKLKVIFGTHILTQHVKKMWSFLLF